MSEVVLSPARFLLLQERNDKLRHEIDHLSQKTTREIFRLQTTIKSLLDLLESDGFKSMAIWCFVHDFKPCSTEQTKKNIAIIEQARARLRESELRDFSLTEEALQSRNELRALLRESLSYVDPDSMFVKSSDFCQRASDALARFKL